MATKFPQAYGLGLHPVHAVLIAATLPLFLGALLSDLAYGSTYAIQWTNFASWLIAGALVFMIPVLIWSVVDVARPGHRARRRHALYLLLVVATFIMGFINALVHAKDGWATMPEAIILSVIVTVLSVATIWVGFSVPRAGDFR